MRGVLVAVLWAWSLAAIAGDQPEFMLQDVGVRVDLSAEWAVTRWTPEDLQADRKDGSAKVYAWATAGQLEPVAADLPGWSKVYTGMVDNLKGKEPVVKRSEVRTVAGRPAAWVDIAFQQGGRDGLLAGASIAVAGHAVHLAVVGLGDRAAALHRDLEAMASRLEVKAAAAPRPVAEEVTGAGIVAKLPTGWYRPLEAESAQASELLGKLGLAQSERCWVAVRPVAGDPMDVVLTCPDGVLLGIVDEASFPDVDTVVRARIFGTAPVAAGTPMQAGDRLGVLYKPELPALSARVLVVPTGAGVARMWWIGASGRGEAMDATLAELATGLRFDGPHPVGVGDQLSYYLAYQPTSPVVLAPAFLVLAGAALVIRALSRPRPSPVDDIA